MRFNCALEHGPDVQLARPTFWMRRADCTARYSGVLPHVTASLSRSNSVTDATRSPGRVGGAISPYDIVTDSESHGTTPGLSGSWSVVNLSNLEGLASAKTALKAAGHQLASSRERHRVRHPAAVLRSGESRAPGSRRHQFAAARARRRAARARAFEVGSVSRSDLLKAEVRTAQSQLDSLTSSHAITVQRNVLAAQIGVPEAQMGEVDTVLTSQLRDLRRERTDQ